MTNIKESLLRGAGVLAVVGASGFGLYQYGKNSILEQGLNAEPKVLTANLQVATGTPNPTETPKPATATPTVTQTPGAAAAAGMSLDAVRTAVAEAIATGVAKEAFPLQTRVTDLQDRLKKVETTPTPVVVEMPKLVEDISHDAWQIQGTDRLKDNPIVAKWLKALKNPNPKQWARFPNIPNPDAPGFKVANGMEYGTYNTPFSEHPKGADFIVGAWEYRYYSGDRVFNGYECRGDKQKGCLYLAINVSEETHVFRGNRVIGGKTQEFDNGFTLRGRYWNGDELQQGVEGVVGHGAANMLNMPTLAREGEVLNAGVPGNSGANCGTPQGCKEVDVMVDVYAGEALIARARTFVTPAGAKSPGV